MVSFKYGYNPIAIDDLPSPVRTTFKITDHSSPDYWNDRFSNTERPFDWLIPASALREFVIQALGKAFLKEADILHIGCGTSNSNLLRDLVPDPRQIHNVDFSQKAIDLGIKREDELLAQEDSAPVEPSIIEEHRRNDSFHDVPRPRHMQWTCLDLRDLDSVFALLSHRYQQQQQRSSSSPTPPLYDLILDKSTSDSISCGGDLRVPLPYPIQRWAQSAVTSLPDRTADVHPLQILAVHLAALTTPRRGRWILVANVVDRLPFVPPFAKTAADGMLPAEAVRGGFPDPRRLWVLERKEEIVVRGEETLAQLRARLQSGRPRLNPWLYVLRRTDVVVTD